MVEFNETCDYDFIKMMPFGAYTVSDWGAKLDIYRDKYKEVEIAAPGIECRRLQEDPAIAGSLRNLGQSATAVPVAGEAG